jgi:hypothetical protein
MGSLFYLAWCKAHYSRRNGSGSLIVQGGGKPRGLDMIVKAKRLQ